MDNKQKEAVMPSYFKSFKCIGGACEDTCCAGWYLPIDEATYKKYKKVKHPEMKRRLDKEIVARKGAVDPTNVAKIKLKNGRCAFLSKEGWCDVHAQLGEGYLSESCGFYPRTVNQINSQYEHSLTLSCPEAARKVLLDPAGIKFEREAIKGTIPTISAVIKNQAQKPKKWEDYFDNYRQACIKKLQDRKASLAQRVESTMLMMQAVDQVIKRHQLKQINETLNKAYPAKDGISLFSQKDFESIIDYLKSMTDGKKLKSTAYEETLSKVVTMDYATYQKAYGIYQNIFAEKLDYILENYLVNYMYERCAPLDAPSPGESIKQLVFYYQLIQLHLMAWIIEEGMLREEVIATFIQGFTKVYDHGEDHMRKLLKGLQSF